MPGLLLGPGLLFWVDLLPLVLGSDLLLRSRPPSGSGVLGQGQAYCWGLACFLG